MLFTDRSLWTIVHGVVLGGAALMALAAALFAMSVMRVGGSFGRRDGQSVAFTGEAGVFIAVVLWVRCSWAPISFSRPTAPRRPMASATSASIPGPCSWRILIPHGCMRLPWRAKSTCPGLLRCSRRQSRS